MHSAIDRATGDTVLAAQATPRRRYRCTRCDAEVMLRTGAVRIPHFAHVAGEADPDCDLFFSVSSAHLGRPQRRNWSETGEDRASGCALFFSEQAGGPQLYFWLPASTSRSNWSGLIRFEANQVTRQLTHSHLERGQLIAFNLLDGQWLITIDGQVSDDYLSQLEVGPGSLESGLNIFLASKSPGPRLGPTDVVRLAESYWIITRQFNFELDRRAASTITIPISSVGGWLVYLMTLPETATVETLANLSGWLQRPVRHARAEIWIDRPWPSSKTPDGTPVIPLMDIGVELKSDTPMDIEIRSSLNGHSVASFPFCSRALWKSVSEGRWTVFGNDAAFLSFVITVTPPLIPAALTVQVNDSVLLDLYRAQELINELATAGQTTASLELRWNCDAIAAIIRLNGISPDLAAGQDHWNFVLRPGDHLHVGNLGSIVWVSTQIIAAPSLKYRKLDEAILMRLRWLISVSNRPNQINELVACVPSSLLKHPVLYRFSCARWPRGYAPHIRIIESQLKAYS